MKKVLLIRSNPITPDPPVEKMANSLLELGYSVTIIGWDRNNNYSINKDKIDFTNGSATRVLFGIQAAYGAGFKGNLVPLSKFQYYLYKWLKKNGEAFEIIHAFDFDTAFLAHKYAKHKNKKLVYHVLDYYVDSHNLSGKIRSIIKKSEDKIIKTSNATIICTEKRKEQINIGNLENLFVIHNTPDISMVDNETSVMTSKSDKMKIVYVGILAGSRMLKEIAEVVSRSNNMEFHVGGFGQLEEYFKETADSHENIYFYGKLPYNKTLALESEGDVMVAIYNPGIRNNQFAAPNKFYEALMIGKPLIMARGTGFDDIIESQKIGVLSDFSSNGIEESLKEILSKRSKWETMSGKAKELYITSYSWDIMKKRIKDIYSSI